MKKILKITLGVLLSIGFLGCGKSELHIYNWPDYIHPDLVEKFEKQYNCKVTVSTYATLEALFSDMENKSREKKYDILFPSTNYARKMYEENMLRVFDHSKIPNIKNISKASIRRSTDSAMRYSVPYMISLTCIAYNKNLVKDFKPSWNMFERDDLAGKIGVLDDMREVVGAALKVNSFSYNSTDDNQLRKIGLTLTKWKKNVGRIDDSENLEAALKSGGLYLIQDYNGDALRLSSEDKNIGFAIPEEGTAINIDSFVIPREAVNVEAAYKFINFFLDAEVSKDNMEYLLYLAPNLPAQRLLSDSFRGNVGINPPQSIILKSDYIVELENNSKHDELWRMLKR